MYLYGFDPDGQLGSLGRQSFELPRRQGGDRYRIRKKKKGRVIGLLCEY